MPPDLEAALVDATRGDHAALAVVYRELNPRLLRYLRHHAGPVAEDLASEVWLALAPRLEGFTGTIANLQALMFSIAHRRVVDEYRRRGRTPDRAPIDEAVDLADPEDAETVVVEAADRAGRRRAARAQASARPGRGRAVARPR